MNEEKKTEKKERRIPVEVYSRVVGYFRPLNQWNWGKQSEFQDRQHFSVNKIKENLDGYN